MTILLLALLAGPTDTLLVSNKLDAQEMGRRANVASSVGIQVLAFQRVGRRADLHWYQCGWITQAAAAQWKRDTVEVSTGEGTFRAVEQFAMTPIPSLRPVPLVGLVPTTDLERRQTRKSGPAVVVWLAFREAFEPKAVTSVRKVGRAGQ